MNINNMGYCPDTKNETTIENGIEEAQKMFDGGKDLDFIRGDLSVCYNREEMDIIIKNITIN